MPKKKIERRVKQIVIQVGNIAEVFQMDSNEKMTISKEERKQKMIRIRKEIKKMKNLDLENKTVIVSGEEDFVKKINDEIYKEIEDYELLNCYKIDNTEDIAKIASEYSIFLNTSGKTELTENSQNEQKRKTIQTQI